jgi:hypothetical protein
VELRLIEIDTSDGPGRRHLRERDRDIAPTAPRVEAARGRVDTDSSEQFACRRPHHAGEHTQSFPALGAASDDIRRDRHRTSPVPSATQSTKIASCEGEFVSGAPTPRPPVEPFALERPIANGGASTSAERSP